MWSDEEGSFVSEDNGSQLFPSKRKRTLREDDGDVLILYFYDLFYQRK